MTAPLLHDNQDDSNTPLRERVNRIVGSNDFPALSRDIIDTISTIDDSANSLQRLANVVLREYSLTLSVVRTANSVHYRRGARPIQSATHAMMMLGARTVRHLASSLLLFENFQRRSPSLRDLMILSLLSANHAREIAVRTNGGDPEEAHLCGMFRNLGEVLVACHFPAEYAEVRELVDHRNTTESSAALTVLGCCYEELGAEIARHWGMPDSVIMSIRSNTGSSISSIDTITQLSHDLTTTIYRRDAENAAGAAAALDELVAQYAPRLRLSRAQVQEVIEAALEETRELFAGARVSIEASHLRNLTNAARRALGFSALGSGEWAAADDASTPIPTQLRTRLKQELEYRIDPFQPTDVVEVLLVALEAVLRGGPFDRVVACVLSADRSRLVARSGLGTGAEELMKRLDFDMSPRGGPLPVILQQRKPQYLPVDRPLSIAEGRWAAAQGVTQFGIVPLVVSTKIVGCLYLDRSGPALPDRAALQFAREIGSVVVKAMDARRRSGAGSSTTAEHPVHEPPRPSAIAWTPEAKGALVLRVLRGESIDVVSQSAGVPRHTLEQWSREFLAGAHERLAAS